MKLDAIDYDKVKAIFLDIGGVILTNGWGHESREKAAKKFSLDYSEMDFRHNFISNVFEVGSISIEEYLDTIIFYAPRVFTKADFKEFMFNQSVELPQLLPWLKTWKKEINIPVFALSNESREINDYRINNFKLHEVFDGFFSSCYVGFRKPDPRIFKTALEISQVKPEESLYFDDRAMLVDTARKLGLNAVQHCEFEATKSILEKFIRK